MLSRSVLKVIEGRSGIRMVSGGVRRKRGPNPRIEMELEDDLVHQEPQSLDTELMRDVLSQELKVAFAKVRMDYEKELADVRGAIPKRLDELEHRVRWCNDDTTRIKIDTKSIEELVMKIAEKVRKIPGPDAHAELPKALPLALEDRRLLKLATSFSGMGAVLGSLAFFFNLPTPKRTSTIVNSGQF